MLSFPGCPHAAPAAALVEEVAAEAGLEVSVKIRDVADRLDPLFRGSPTILVNGRDVDPDAASPPAASDALSCRIYSTPAGPQGLPPRGWVRDALANTGA